MGCRKNQATLSPGEKAAFVNAVIALKAAPSLAGLASRYDDFVQEHVDSMTGGNAWAHRRPAFLPWHREYLRRYELALQEHDPGVTLPYWDWTVDNSAASSIWNADFMGGDGTGAERRGRNRCVRPRHRQLGDHRGRPAGGPAREFGQWPEYPPCRRPRRSTTVSTRRPTTSSVERLRLPPELSQPARRLVRSRGRSTTASTCGSAGRCCRSRRRTTRCSGCTTATSTACGRSGSASIRQRLTTRRATRATRSGGPQPQ